MKREACWLTFSEALEKYLDARENARHFGEGRKRAEALEDMEIAKQHMDALTAKENDNG